MMRGFPQDVVLLGGFAILVTVVAARMSLMVIALCIAIAFKAMPLLRHLFAGESDFMEILTRAFRYGHLYPRQAREVPNLYQDTVGG